MDAELYAVQTRPKPYLIEFDRYGKVELGWSTPVKAVEDVGSIDTVTVAVKEKDVQQMDKVIEQVWIVNRDVMENKVESYSLQPAIQVIYMPW